MRCEEVRSLIADYLDEDHEMKVETEFREHLQQCTECRGEFEQLRKIWIELGNCSVPVHEGAETRAALIAAVKWRSNMKAALKAVAAIVIFAGLAVGAGTFLKSGSKTDTRSHIRGSDDAAVELVEYGDYECPPCYAHQYHVMIDRLLEKYPGLIRYEFRHFPITTIHPNALLAAKVAEAAGTQGKFWEMHKLLLSSHDRWARNPQARDVFLELAKQIGLQPESFKRSLDSPELEQTILNEAARAREAGINATPTFLVNGKKLEPTPATFDEFDNQIRGLLHQR